MKEGHKLIDEASLACNWIISDSQIWQTLGKTVSNLLLGEFECYQLSITLDLTVNINLHYDQLHFLHLQCENQIRGCIAGTCTTMMEMEFLTKMTLR